MRQKFITLTSEGTGQHMTLHSWP